MKPDISVIIPSYNAEKYILQTLESVRYQTYDGLIETIVVDDCSKDGSLEVVKAFARESENYPNRPVRWFRNDVNSGVAEARNTGAFESRGDYICYLDSDDYWDPEKIEKQVELIEAWALKPGCDAMPVLFCTGRELVNESGESLGKVVHVPSVITYKEMLKTNLVPCSSVMLKREAALEFPMERDDLVEDYIDWLKIIKEYGPAAGVDEPLLKYRVMQGTRSANKIKAAKSQYKALRYVGISPLPAFAYLISYMINGVKKLK